MQAAVKHCHRGGGEGINRSEMKCEGYVQVSKEGMQAAPPLGEADGRRGAAAVQHCRGGTEELGVLVGGGAAARELTCHAFLSWQRRAGRASSTPNAPPCTASRHRRLRAHEGGSQRERGRGKGKRQIRG
jgi:hypothetical protein